MSFYKYPNSTSRLVKLTSATECDHCKKSINAGEWFEHITLDENNTAIACDDHCLVIISTVLDRFDLAIEETK